MHNRRQLRQKDIGLPTGENEVPTDKQAIPAAIARGDTTIQREWKNLWSIDRRQLQIAREVRSKPARQKETISYLKAHCVGNTFHGQPALARDYGIAFDAFMPREFDCEVPTQIEASGPVTPRFQQQEHI